MPQVLSRMQSSVTVCALLLLTVSVQAHVVENFEGCRGYFYRNVWPVWGLSKHHKEICQSLDNKYYFATLYDTHYRIPVYSAYVFEQGKDEQDIPWCVEPQLVNKAWDKNMIRGDELAEKKKVTIDKIGENQAVYEDYQTSLKDTYNHGHLNPKGHHTGDGSKATFTLTNVVPQNKKLNNGAWSVYEADLKNKIFKGCHKAFVLVGAIPSSNPEKWIKIKNKNRVNIPDYMWHAYCCVNDEGNPILSGAAVAKNTDANTVERCSLDSLQQFFEKLNKKPELFKNCKIPANNNIKGDCSSVIE